jgi:hypothetical protein
MIKPVVHEDFTAYGRRVMYRIVVIALAGFALASCDRSGFRGTPGSGVAKTETREFGPINQIKLMGAGTLEVVVGQPQSIVVTCDDNILPLIEMRETDGRLVVSPLEKIRSYELVIRATVADIKRLELDGAAKSTIEGVNNDDFAIKSNGAASVTVTGKTNALDINLDGVGRVNAGSLSARKGVVRLAGAGAAEINAAEELDVTIDGMGVVRYRGNPRITKQISGLGKLTKRK